MAAYPSVATAAVLVVTTWRAKPQQVRALAALLADYSRELD